MTSEDLSTVGNDEQNFKNKVKIKECRVIINCNDEVIRRAVNYINSKINVTNLTNKCN